MNDLLKDEDIWGAATSEATPTLSDSDIWGQELGQGEDPPVLSDADIWGGADAVPQVADRKIIGGKEYRLGKESGVVFDDKFKIVDDPQIRQAFGLVDAPGVTDYAKELGSATVRGVAGAAAATGRGLNVLTSDNPSEIEYAEQGIANLKNMSAEEATAFMRELPSRLSPAVAFNYQVAIRKLWKNDVEGAQPYLDQARKYIDTRPIAEQGLSVAGKKLEDATNEAFPQDPRFKGSITSDIGQAAGSSLFFLPIGLLTGGTGVAVAGAAAGADQTYQAAKDAIENGDFREDRGGLYNAGLGTAAETAALQAGRLGALPGASEVVPTEIFLEQMPKYIPGLRTIANTPAWGRFAKAFGRVGTQVLSEGGQEAFQQWASNVIQKLKIDPSQDVTEDVLYNALLGGVVGGGMQTGVEAYTAVFGKDEQPSNNGGPINVSPRAPQPGQPGGPRIEPQLFLGQPPSSGQAAPPPGAPPPEPPISDDAWLMGAGYTPEQISDMNPEERASAAEEARQQGVEPVDLMAGAPAPGSAPMAPRGTRRSRVDVQSEQDLAEVRPTVNAEPTPAQAAAGNYQKGHIKIHGFDVSIENPRGSVRRGTDEDGTDWASPELPADYGYIKGTTGKDGDHVDVYIGSQPESDRIFVIDQVNPKTGEFDEHKAVIGATSTYDAADLYTGSFDNPTDDPYFNHNRIGAITEMTADEFRDWVKKGRNTKRPAADSGVGQVMQRAPQAQSQASAPQAAEISTVNQPEITPQPAADNFDAIFQQELDAEFGPAVAPPAAAPTPKRRKYGAPKPVNVLDFIASIGGIQDPTGELRGMDLPKMGPFGPVIRKNGLHPDKVREALVERGFLHDKGFGTDQQASTTENDVYDLIARHMSGQKVYAPEDEARAADLETTRRAEFQNPEWEDTHPIVSRWGQEVWDQLQAALAEMGMDEMQWSPREINDVARMVSQGMNAVSAFDRAYMLYIAELEDMPEIAPEIAAAFEKNRANAMVVFGDPPPFPDVETADHAAGQQDLPETREGLGADGQAGAESAGKAAVPGTGAEGRGAGEGRPEAGSPGSDEEVDRPRRNALGSNALEDAYLDQPVTMEEPKPAPTTEKGAENLPAVSEDKTLYVQFGKRRFEMQSYEQASEAILKLLEKTGGTFSGQTGPKVDTPLIIDASGNVVGHISQNGRVWAGDPKDWKPGAKPLYDPAETPAIENGADNKPQLVIPGAEQDQKGALKNAAKAPLKGTKPQQGMDVGLFGSERDQTDMFDKPAAKPVPKPKMVPETDEAFGEPAVRINDRVFKASDYFPTWEKGTRENGLGIAEDQELGDWGHNELLDHAREVLGTKAVDTALEGDPEAVLGHVDASGRFKGMQVAEPARPNVATGNQKIDDLISDELRRAKRRLMDARNDGRQDKIGLVENELRRMRANVFQATEAAEKAIDNGAPSEFQPYAHDFPALDAFVKDAVRQSEQPPAPKAQTYDEWKAKVSALAEKLPLRVKKQTSGNDKGMFVATVTSGEHQGVSGLAGWSESDARFETARAVQERIDLLDNAKLEPKKAEPKGKPEWKKIGVNAKGNPVFEDENGVRSYTEKGIRVSEPVQIIPGQGVAVDTTNRRSDFLPVDEKPASSKVKSAKDQGREAAMRGDARSVPMDVRKAGARAVSDWYDGWDAGNAAAPVPGFTAAEQQAMPSYGASNTLVSKDRAEELRAKLKAKLKGQINAGIDPEMLAMGAELAAFHIEAGARRFSDFARAIAADLGATIKQIRPYLRSWYNGARDMMEDAGLDVAGMDTPDEVKAALAALDQENDNGSGNGLRQEAPGVPAAGEPGPVQEPEPERPAGEPLQDGGSAGGGNVREPQRPDADGEGSAGGLRPEGAGTRGNTGNGGRARSPRTGARTPAESADVKAETARLEKERAERRALNYRITPEDRIGQGGPKEKVANNIAAIRTLKTILEEKRAATPEEKRVLVRYVGWGAFAQDVFAKHKAEWAKERAALADLLTAEEFASARASTLNAHYTSEDVIRGMWKAMEHLGFDGGRALEPSSGVGHFVGLIPDPLAASTDWGVVELDTVTGNIAKLLYEGADVNVMGFEKFNRPPNFYDIAISNVPFGNFQIRDPKRPGYFIHDYFFVKGLDLVRPGGIVAFITSSGTMDKAAQDARKAIAKRADFVGAIRLPGGKRGAFSGNAGTEVTTDIIFLRKRDASSPRLPDAPKWMDLKTIQTPDGPVDINEYFADHPDMMLGQMRLTGSMYREKSPVLEGDTERMGERIAEAAAKLPKDIMLARSTSPTVKDTQTVEATEGGKEGGYFEKGGKLYRKIQGVGQPQNLPATETEKIKALIGIRDIVNELLGNQAKGKTKDNDALRAKLNKAYDAFVRKHGPINLENTTTTNRMTRSGDYVVITKRPNFAKFSLDPDAFKVAAIENYDPDTKKAAKAAIFTADILGPAPAPQIASSADTIGWSLNAFGRLNLPEMASLAGKSEAQLVADLGDLIYEDPVSALYQPRDQYLSGDVVTKLEEAEGAAEADPRYKRNVEALKKVQPAPLTREDIRVPFGAPWVPADVYTAFFRDELDSDIVLTLNPVTKRWGIKSGRYSRTAETKYATPRYRIDEAIKSALDQTPVRIMDKDANGNLVLNPQASEEAQVRVNALREAFAGSPDGAVPGWIWNDDERAVRLEAVYNKAFNRLVPQKFDGSHLSLPGLAATITDSAGQKVPFALRQHQKNAVARIIQNGNTLLAHVVGAGKTFTMIAAGMEQRRLGQKQRPMFIVPNHMLEQFSREFLQAYPGANILVAQKDEMTRENRKAFAAKIAAQKWDGIIITHDAFGRIRMSKEAYEEFTREEIEAATRAKIAAAEEEGKGSPTVKDLEKLVKKLETKLANLIKEERKDEGVTFEELGVDQIYLDEAHLFKNLSFFTRHTRIKGIGGTASQRATDLFMKIRHLEKAYPGRSTVFATGTPVSNTMAEMYTMQRYLQLETLREYGVDEFDAWAATFGEVRSQMELGPDGRTLRETTSFSRFINIPELYAMYSRVADAQTADMLNLPRPKRKGGKAEIVEAEFSPREEAVAQSIVQRAEQLKGKKAEKGADNMLKVVSDGRKLATDARLLNPDMPYNPKGKTAKLIDNVFRIWKDAEFPALAQMIFLDMGVPQAKQAAAKPAELEDDDTAVDVDLEAEAALSSRFDLYNDIRDRLVSRGIPREQIAFIHEANDDIKKARLFGKVRNGEVRVLIGSTAKMGVGTNVQRLLIALHHDDAPWKPAEVEQRDGRGERQGNLNPEITIYRYITKKSMDAFMWQTLERKSQFIGQLLSGAKGVRHAEDIDSPLPEAADMKAAATGDPRIMEQADLTKRERELKVAKSSHDRVITEAKRGILATEAKIAHFEREAAAMEKDAAHVVPTTGEAFKITLDLRGRPLEYTGRKEAGERLRQFGIDQGRVTWGPPKAHDVGQISGFTVQMVLKHSDDGVEYAFGLQGEASYGQQHFSILTEDADPLGMVRRIENILADVPRMAKHTAEERDRARKTLTNLKAAAAERPFPRQAELDDVSSRLKALNDEFKKENEKKQQPPAPEAPKQAPLGGLKRRDAAPEDRRNPYRYIATKKQTAEIITEVQAVAERILGHKLAGVSVITDQEAWNDMFSAEEDAVFDPNTGIIYLALHGMQDLRSTIRHEAVHALRQAGVISAKEWAVLSRMAQTRWIAQFNIRARYEKLYRERFDLGEAELEQLLIEEAIADAMADSWGKPPAEDVVGRIFARIKAFLEAVRNALRGQGFTTASQIIEGVERGSMSTRRAGTGQGRDFLLYARQNARSDATEIGYHQDNPGGRWLAEKQAYAEEDMARAKTPSGRKGLYGTTTAATGNILMPVRDLLKVPGANNERPGPGNPKFDELDRDIAQRGYTNEDQVVVVVNHKGEAYINEGNNRVAAAAKHGVSEIRAKVYWLNGGELAKGAWSPDAVAAKAKPFQQTLSSRRRLTPRQNAAPGSFEAPHDERVLRALADSTDTLLNRLKRAGRAFGAEFRRKTQDREIDLLRTQNAIEQAGGPLAEPHNAYLAASLYPGRVAQRDKDLVDDVIEPLIKDIARRGLSLDEVNDFVMARHAIERNLEVGQLHKPGTPFHEAMTSPTIVGASGWSEQEVNDTLDAYQRQGKLADLEAVGDKIVDLNRRTLARLYAEGLIAQEQYDALTQKYQYYVPLRGFDDVTDESHPDSPKTGRRYDIRGREFERALGRTSKADSPLAYSIMQARQAIIRIEKNRVGKRFLRLAQANPNEAFWEVNRVDLKRIIDPRTGFVRNIFDRGATEAENVYAVKVGGKRYNITLHHEGLLRAMKGIGGENMGDLVAVFHKINRFFAMMNTQLDPEFIFRNFLRDVQQAGIVIQEEKARGLTKKILLSIPKAAYGMNQMLQGKVNGTWARYAREFADAGGKIGFMDRNDIELEKRNLEKLMKEATAGWTARTLRAANEQTLERLARYNDTIENTLRLSTYVALRQAGATQDRAAFVARELTVNFNRKGEWGPALNAFYLFYNASMQGAASLFMRLHRSRKMRLVAGGLIVEAFLMDILNRMIGGDDDDDKNRYDKIPLEEKARNHIFMMPKWFEDKYGVPYYKVPLPLGWNWFNVVGQQAAGAVSGAVTPLEAFGNIAGTFADSFNPLGSGDFLSTVTPTLLDPPLEISRNKDFFGESITPRQFDETTPNAERSKQNVNPVAKWLTDTLSSTTGGSPERAGAIDISPEWVEHLADFTFGGLGRFFTRSFTTIENWTSDEDLDTGKIPFRRVFEGRDSTFVDRDEYFQIRDAVHVTEKELKARIAEGDREAAMSVRRDHAREVKMIDFMDIAEKQLAKLRKDYKAVKNAQKMSEAGRAKRLEVISQRMDEIQRKVRTRWHQLGKNGETTSSPVAR